MLEECSSRSSSLFPLSISNPAVIPNTHARTHARTRRHFSLNWVLQRVQSKDDGKNMGAARGARRTLQGEFDFYSVLTAARAPNTRIQTHVLPKPRRRGSAEIPLRSRPNTFMQRLTRTPECVWVCVWVQCIFMRLSHNRGSPLNFSVLQTVCLYMHMCEIEVCVCVHNMHIERVGAEWLM